MTEMTTNTKHLFKRIIISTPQVKCQKFGDWKPSTILQDHERPCTKGALNWFQTVLSIICFKVQLIQDYPVEDIFHILNYCTSKTTNPNVYKLTILFRVMHSTSAKIQPVKHSELLGFWTLPIVRYFWKIENTVFWKLDGFPSSGEGGRHQLCWVP
jgi:hypothetical protein